MKVFCACLFVTLMTFVSPAAVDQKDHDRILHGRPLSDKQHHDDIEGEEADYDYDHEAFLGQDVAEDYDNLSPEEAQRRLAIIVDKMDVDGNQEVTVEELQNWIKFTQQRYVSEDVEKQWEQHSQEDGEHITWEQYRTTVYGFLDEEDEVQKTDGGFSYAQMEARDNRRWNMADSDHDGKLTKMEFQAFLHPEDAEHMRDIVVTETLEDIDKDGDGKVSLTEYIGDMYHGENDETEPEWVVSEKEQFAEFRDKNGDGFMDLEEVKAWIIPPDFDHSGAEAKHLIYESDQNQDGVLTKQEILEKYDLFVGSQATDFGEALSRHDEF